VRQRIALAAKVTEKSAAILLLMALSVAGAIFLIYTTWAILHPYPLDYGEAPLVDQAVRLAAGENIYRTDLSSPPYTISNYPPFYVLLLAPFVKLFGPTFLAGRAISVVSALASATFLSLIIYSWTKHRLAAATTGLFLLANPYVTHWSGLLRIDLLALAFSTAALYLLTKQPASRRRVIAGALLLVAAIFTRQSYALAAPLAAFVSLWFQPSLGDSHDASMGGWPRFLSLDASPGRRRALGLAVMVGGLTLLFFFILNISTHGGFYFNVVTANVNKFDMEQLEWHLGQLRDTAPILLALSGIFLLFAHRKLRVWPLVASYLIGASLAGLTIGKIGSNVNYLLELSAAFSLVAGAAIAWTGEHRWLRAILLMLLSLQVGLLIQTTSDDYIDQLLERRGFSHEIRELEDIVAGTEGEVLADEYMGLITLQGQALYIQPFEVTQLANAGLWDQSAFVENIQNKEFPMILIHHFPDFPVYESRWTPEMLSAIEKNYYLSHSLADTFVYRPRGSRLNDSIKPLFCPSAQWQMPTSGGFGIQWSENGLNVFGWGNKNTVPVYAVADGVLTRPSAWEGAVAIQHDDPLNPGDKVWTVYADMLSASGHESYILDDFPPGSTEIPVNAGQLLGYQGEWSGRIYWPKSIHLRFAVVNEIPSSIMMKDDDFKNALDPTLYLGISLNDGDASPYLQTLRCKEDND
jgi:hypothetical protein